MKNYLLKRIPTTNKGLESMNDKLRNEIAILEGLSSKSEVEYLKDEIVVEEVNGFSIYDGKDKLFCIDRANMLYIFSKRDLGIIGNDINYDELEKAVGVLFLDADEIKSSIIPIESVDRFEDPMSQSDELNTMYTYINGNGILDAPEGFFIYVNEEVIPLSIKNIEYSHK